MRWAERAQAAGLDRATTALLTLSLVLAFLHHADHVLRVDHSGWPFRPMVTTFTYSLLAYPMVLFALFGARRLYWLRWALLAIATGVTIYAHTALESPRMQFAMWAENRSLDPHAAGVHNLPGVRSPILGTLAVVIGMALNLTAIAATLAMARRGLALGRGA
ncbi:hypothetical protein D3218_18930 [Aureimonas flava]|uniref:Uncharacterized protein n=1 Tax=Aureimonas flava TaxID=2320271 RepID=A0A3A1WMF7_9HYPH|nr:hypothetical protein [Aureimonas flava]RIX97290.1 hypothetical protein D3218_18930 [Aureimonas flava]